MSKIILNSINNRIASGKKKGDTKVKIGKLTLVDKKIEDLEINEGTFPFKNGKFKGCSVGRDSAGYFVFTHRARSPSFKTPQDIPIRYIKFIETTGTKF